VKIVKSIATGSDQTKTFDFSTSTVPGWSPTGNLGHNGSYQLDVTAAGSYTVTETVPTGWNNPSISCVDPDAGSTLGPQVGTAATFGVSQANIDNDETITCTFTNSETPVIINPGTPGGTIIVDKVTLPTGASDSFAFSLTPQGGTAVPFSLTDAAAPFASNQPVGTYAVAETVPAGWDLSSATCSDGSSPAAVNLGSGEVVTCTFTNTQRGSITAVLDLVPLSGNGAARTILARFAATDFVFTGDLAATLLNDGDSIGPNEVAPATYSTTEIVPDGWDLTSIDCSDGNSSGNTGTGTATFVVDPGEDVVCTFTNVEEEVKGGITGPGQPGAEDETPEVLARPATALPLTGSDPAGLIAIAALLILSGATSILYARQRRSS
jgi:LPXTG-motif cell wall-anchored protein